MNNSEKRIHTAWTNIKQRCYNKKHKQYCDYGGRNITICDEWKNNFKAFLHWALCNGYNNNLTIDGIDNNGNYEPNNYRWVTEKEQSVNKRVYKNNKTGYRGVYIRGNKYRVEIKQNGKTIYIGTYLNLKEALKARENAELKYYGKKLEVA